MSKRIVLCFDGTWNTPSERFVGLKRLHQHFAELEALGEQGMREAIEHPDPNAGPETNACRFYRAVRRTEAAAGRPGQTKWYDKGVGTNWYDRIRGGAFGLGLSRKIREGYQFLSDTYEAGDDVFVLGFSRGAYSARSLVGMIRNCGLLPAGSTGGDPDSDSMMQAYELYRTRDEGPDSERARAFRRSHRAPIIRIKFLGVWDTVGALGIPIETFAEFNKWAFQFHDTELSGIVENACHAVAVDEHREPFAVTLWDPKMKLSQMIEQRWFIGAHADVGGGYENRALSDVTLRWMQEKAAASGLTLDPAGVPKAAADSFLAGFTDSFAAFLGGVFQLFQTRYYRPVRKTPFGQERVDDSVAARMRSDVSYRPANPGLLPELVG